MRASFHSEQRAIERLFDIAFRDDMPPPALSLPGVAAAPILVDAQADVDISDPVFDFVRSIRVFEITYHQQHNPHDGCERWGSVFLGTYGEQGDYSRRRSNISAVPEASELKIPENCISYRHRSVFVDWRDYAGTYGHVEVQY
jgi:hypothetical protein